MRRINKLIATGLLVTFMLTGSLAFAGPGGNGESRATDSKGQSTSGYRDSGSGSNNIITKQQQPQTNQGGKTSVGGQQQQQGQQAFKFQSIQDSELQAKLKAIKANQVKLWQLNQQIKSSVKEVKNTIKALRKQPDTVTEAQIDQLRIAIQLLKSEIKAVSGTNADIAKATQQLKLRRQNRDLSACKTNLDQILVVQAQRLQSLNTTKVNLENLLANL